MKNILAITLTSAVLFGCTSTTSMSLKEKDNLYEKYVSDENFASKDKIKDFKFSGWKSLSDNYLIITDGHKKDYLIETKGRCLDLNNSIGIKLNRSSNTSFYKNGDSISPVKFLDNLPDSTSHGGEVTGKCLIKSIYSITNEQADYLVNIGQFERSES